MGLPGGTGAGSFLPDGPSQALPFSCFLPPGHYDVRKYQIGFILLLLFSLLAFRRDGVVGLCRAALPARCLHLPMAADGPDCPGRLCLGGLMQLVPWVLLPWSAGRVWDVSTVWAAM